MKKILIISLIAVVFVIGGLYLAYLLMCEDDWCYHYEWQRERRANEINSDTDSNYLVDSNNLAGNEATEEITTEIPVQPTKPILSNLGINIEPFNAQTKKAGDLVCTKDLLFDDGRVDNDKVLVDFGHKAKYFEEGIGNIEYWFHVPLGTDVKAPISGTVEVGYIEHTKDWAVSIKQSNHEYAVSFEHLVDVKVKEGDSVKVGDVLGDASPRNTFQNKIAMVEMAVWTGGSSIVKYCPFDFLDESLKPEYTEKINSIVKDWEAFIGKDVYQQENWVSPGCLKDMIIEK